MGFKRTILQGIAVIALASLAFSAAATPSASYFIYDEQGHVIGEYDANGNPVQEHIYLGDKPVAVAMTSGGATTIDNVTTDQLNTPRAVTDSGQNLLWSWNSDPFGNGQPTGSLNYNLRFPGQYYDAETGHSYNYWRDYDPGTGRFTESDPNGLLGGDNTYGYALENPDALIDPSGLAVTGSWIDPPKLNIEHFGIDNTSVVFPTLSMFGYLEFIQVTGHASGYINIDVKCRNDCPTRNWEIHNKIDVAASGSFKFGPNLLALFVGFKAGARYGILLNVLLASADLLYTEHQVLTKLVNAKAGPILQSVLAAGPTAICRGSEL